MRIKILLSLAIVCLSALTATAATSLNSGGNVRVATGWSNGLPSSTNEGTISVNGIFTGSDTFGYGAGAIINHTSGNIVAQVQGTKRRGMNMNGRGTWEMSGGSITARYINANGSNSIFDLSGGVVILQSADNSTVQFQTNSSGLMKVSGDVVLDGSDSTASPLVGSGLGYEISSGWTGSWIQGNHSGSDWKTVLTSDSGFKLDGVSITNQLFDENFQISGDGRTLSMLVSVDSDSDGMDDAWEIQNGLNVGVNDSAIDNDANGGPDGLTNLEEFINGTDPQDSDSDNDGLLDGVETNTGIFVSSSNTGTDPNVADTDGDGTNDGAEVAQGTDPLVIGSRGKITVYLLGGQSNMEGSAFVTGNIPEEEKLDADLFELPEILLYVAGSSAGTESTLSNQLITLQPHAKGSGGVAIGPEIGFGERMRELRPDKKIALLKYSYRGTNLHTQWDPGADNNDTANWGVQYTAFVATINSGLAALRAEGWEPEIEGMLWVQGENDATTIGNANAYSANLTQLIARVREQYAADAAPSGIRFVAGQVLPAVNITYPGRDVLRQAIANADEDSGAASSVINTGVVHTNVADHPLRTDNVHFNSIGILALGRSMAYEMLELEETNYAEWVITNGVTGGELDDDDNDGVSNQLEFVLGGDPTDGAGLPTQNVRTIDVAGVTYHSFEFSRDLNASNTAVSASMSYDLEDWTTHLPIHVSTVTQPDGTALVTYRSVEPFDSSVTPRAFFRVVVE